MLTRFARIFLCICLSSGLTGCGTIAESLFQPDGAVDGLSPFSKKKVTSAGTTPVFDNPKLDRIDLLDLLRDNLPKNDRHESCQGSPPSTSNDDGAIYYYLEKYRSCATPDEATRARDSIQDMILAVSDRYCHTYVRLLSQADNDVNFTFGGLTTILGGMSAIFTNPTTARILGGGAGISGGLGAEFNRNFLKDQMVHVIVSGINMGRRDQHGAILKEREKDIRHYTVERAIKDAIGYNTACSLSAGLDKVKDVVSTSGIVGLKTATDIMKQVNLLHAQNILNGNSLGVSTDPKVTANAQAIIKSAEPPSEKETELKDNLVTFAADEGRAKAHLVDLAPKITALQAAVAAAASDAAKQKATDALNSALQEQETWQKALSDATANKAATQAALDQYQKITPIPAPPKPSVTFPFSGAALSVPPNVSPLVDAAKAGATLLVTPRTNKGSEYCTKRFTVAQSYLLAAGVPAAQIEAGSCQSNPNPAKPSTEYRAAVVTIK